jgi:hypothetical protein
MAGIFTSLFARSFRGAPASCTPFARAAPFSTAAARPASRVLQQARLSFPRPRAFATAAPSAESAVVKISPLWRAAGVGALGLGLLSLSAPRGMAMKEIRCEPRECLLRQYSLYGAHGSLY